MSNKNWAGNYTYQATDVYTPERVDDLAKWIKDQPLVRVLGTRHSFNDIADTTGTHISLAKLNRVVSLDRGVTPTVTVEGGITYTQLAPWLATEGFALHNLASLPHISVVGACATATHGSGVRNGSLSTAVVGMEIVKGDGSVVTLAGDDLDGTVVGIGALGVVSKLTLKLEKAFDIRQEVYEHLPHAQLLPNFDAIMSAAYSVSLFTDWSGDSVNQVWFKRIESDAPLPTDLLVGATTASRRMHPIAALSAEHCNEQLGIPGPAFERLPHFRMGFTPSSGEELQSEYFVARKDAVEAFKAIDTLRAEIAPLILITEVRTIAADRFWLSPCYERDCIAFHFTWKQDWPKVKALLPKIEAALRPFRPRPHWAKLFTMPADELQSRFPRFDDFRKLVETYDPAKKFRNAYIDRYLFDSAN